jgi:nicotinate phosphoribosyltransferase
MIIQSILDNDLYKFLMGQAIMKSGFAGVIARYCFMNRDPNRGFNRQFVERLKERIAQMAQLRLTPLEISWLALNVPVLASWYIEWLSKFRFDPNDIEIEQDERTGALTGIDIVGRWETAIYWEVPLMALISETYFEMVGHRPSPDSITVVRAEDKINTLNLHNLDWLEYGTRRRRSFVEQEAVVANAFRSINASCKGTSNVYLSMQNGRTPRGTMAHEWVMGVGALMGLRYANRYAMEKWIEVYHGKQGIALPDTYGSTAFYRDFDTALAKTFDGLRQDSGDPVEFLWQAVSQYRERGISPRHKTIVFSDGLDVDKCIELQHACDDAGINASFGIGTNMTNDDPESPALNMVIKLWELDDIPVAKLSDTPGKACGTPSAIAEARYVFEGASLVNEY